MTWPVSCTGPWNPPTSRSGSAHPTEAGSRHFRRPPAKLCPFKGTTSFRREPRCSRAVSANVAPFLVRGLAGASDVWLADLELARLGRGDRVGVRSPQVAGDGPHEHHGK